MTARLTSRRRPGFGWTGALMIAPALVLYLLFVLIPIGQSAAYSLYDWDGMAANPDWVGFGNYAETLGSKRFWNAFRNNAVWAALSFVPMALGLVLAAMLYHGRYWGSVFFRLCFILPFTLSQVIVAVIWMWIYNPEWGTVNTVLRSLGLESLTQSWLSNPHTSLIAMNVVGSWTWFGFCMVIFLAGLQSSSGEVYEAAKMDGAGPIRTFFQMTVPLQMPQIRLLSIITVIFSFKVFDIVYVMTRGGPFQSTEVLGLLVYIQAFDLFRVGLASATAMILTVLVFLLTLGVMLASRED